MKSIIQGDREACFLCGREANHEHHIFNGTANRKKSEKQGMKVYLCWKCHEKVHNDQDLDLKLKRYAERCWMHYYQKDEEEFRKEFGKSYLDG